MASSSWNILCVSTLPIGSIHFRDGSNDYAGKIGSIFYEWQQTNTICDVHAFHVIIFLYIYIYISFFWILNTLNGSTSSGNNNDYDKCVHRSCTRTHIHMNIVRAVVYKMLELFNTDHFILSPSLPFCLAIY